MHRKVYTLIVAFFVAIGATIVSPTSAMAALCHCYGLARTLTANHGATDNLTVYCLYVDDPDDYFDTEEMWVNTDNDDIGHYWVEEGMGYGVPVGGRRYWYWAESRPYYGYLEYDMTFHSADLNTVYTSTIKYAGSGQWDVYEHGIPLGSSYSHSNTPAPSPRIDVGEEEKTTSDSADAVHDSLRYKDTHGTWHSYLPNAFLVHHNPPYAQWFKKAHSVHTYSNCSAEVARTAAPKSAPSTEQLVRHAEQFAKKNGEKNPSDVRYVKTTQARAAQGIAGAEIHSASPVVVVAMDGEFNGAMAKVPEGGKRPTGNELYMTFDGSTGDVTGWGIAPRKSNLAELGTVRRGVKG